ncbi:hypothetical protein EVAR_54046_1 [Eumeta japonica]|uniref:Uncharacterized protein n=1 Tax=Eumeta variegata TaxID=151549 RepID=A0A4C1YRT3_EUMVA|nr:hypothetical protein EVAR_54046_1 [Eumeta japonica]
MRQLTSSAARRPAEIFKVFNRCRSQSRAPAPAGEQAISRSRVYLEVSNVFGRAAVADNFASLLTAARALVLPFHLRNFKQTVSPRSIETIGSPYSVELYMQEGYHSCHVL